MSSSAALHPLPEPVAKPRSLRLWPGLIAVVAFWIFLEVLPRLELDSRLFLQLFQWVSIGFISGYVLWWLLLSRAPWIDRGVAILLCVGCGFAIWPLRDPSIQPRYGALMYVAYALPVVMAAWIGWLFVTPFLQWPIRRIGLLLAIAVAWIYPTLLRLDGTTSDIQVTVNYRWKPTLEESFMAEKAALAHATAAKLDMRGLQSPTPEDWPGFRGRNRDGHRPGERIATNWKEQKPREVWRRRVGPGWGSFAIVGDYLFTQEQRGEQEAVVCYDAKTGTEVWEHLDRERFYEPVGGPGPRGTPTFYEGRLYTLGATGRLNCLDPASGNCFWTRNTPEDTKAKMQEWGYTASPIAAAGVVTVFVGGAEEKSVIGYKTIDGTLAWTAGTGTSSYSSTHLARLGGVEQLLMATNTGLTSFDPSTGRVLWHHSPPETRGARANGAPIIQPTIIGDSDVLFGTGDGGTWRVNVVKNGDSWKTKQVWESRAIKPYFNDMVVHKGFIYGFDGSSTVLFACVDLATGKLKWRERGYGGGQVLLLPDQDLLLVLTEKNDVALVEANPEKRMEICKIPMLEGVKSWSHPVVAKGKLYIRNDQEAACYDVAEKSPK
ncbi:PQQ-binding-like beta-propeller repeat protein [soil metagenome]